MQKLIAIGAALIILAWAASTPLGQSVPPELALFLVMNVGAIYAVSRL